jgi:glycosyltransferase involved in cell wall biosynthesis
MPAYRAELTLAQTVADIPADVADLMILVDDASPDNTAALARELGIEVYVHSENRGYGGNQKTCYTEALRLGADVVVMLHPDYQYTPKLLMAMASMIAVGHFDVVLASRILSGGALAGGMPVYKYFSNRVLTAVENLITGAKLSEYHTGYRAFSRRVLETLPLEENSDDFVFDAEMLAQCLYFGFKVGEVSCPTRYADDSSSISFSRSVKYGLGVLGVTAKFRAAKLGIGHSSIFDPQGRRLQPSPPMTAADPVRDATC